MTIDLTWKEVAILLTGTVVVAASTAAAFAAAWRQERRRRIDAEQQQGANRFAGSVSDSSTLMEIRNGVEQLALELERLGEIERFAMRRLAERQPERERIRGASTTPVPRSVTPH